MKLSSIRLRVLARSDAPAIRAALRDGQVARFTSRIPYPLPDGAEYEVIARHKAGETEAFAIVGYVEGIEQFLGLASIFPARHAGGAANEIGYWVDPRYWGQGVASEAVAQLCEKARIRGYDALCAGAMIDNPASQAVLLRNGFVETGESECESLGRGEGVAAISYVVAL